MAEYYSTVCMHVYACIYMVGTVVKNPLANAGNTGDMGSIPGSGRLPGERNGTPLQYSCLENPKDRGAWQATVCRVTESDRTECQVYYA